MLVVAGGIALLFGLKSEAGPKAPVATEPSQPEAKPAPEPSYTGAPEKPADDKFPIVKPRPPSQIPTIAVDVPKPAEDEIQYRPDGVPIAVADLDILRDTAATTDYQVLDCINQHGGKDVTGQVITTYLVARKKDEKTGKYTTVVESSGFEEDGTTITDPKLVECMHKTAHLMKFPPSDSPVAAWVRRRITVKEGRLGDNWVFQHGYIK